MTQRHLALVALVACAAMQPALVAGQMIGPLEMMAGMEMTKIGGMDGFDFNRDGVLDVVMPQSFVDMMTNMMATEAPNSAPPDSMYPEAPSPNMMDTPSPDMMDTLANATMGNAMGIMNTMSGDMMQMMANEMNNTMSMMPAECQTMMHRMEACQESVMLPQSSGVEDQVMCAMEFAYDSMTYGSLRECVSTDACMTAVQHMADMDPSMAPTADAMAEMIMAMVDSSSNTVGNLHMACQCNVTMDTTMNSCMSMMDSASAGISCSSGCYTKLSLNANSESTDAFYCEPIKNMSGMYVDMTSDICGIEKACGGDSFMATLDNCTLMTMGMTLIMMESMQAGDMDTPIASVQPDPIRLHAAGQANAPTVCPASCEQVNTIANTNEACAAEVFKEGSMVGEMLMGAKERCSCGALVNDVNTGCFFESNMTHHDFMACPTSCRTSIDNIKKSACVFEASVMDLGVGRCAWDSAWTNGTGNLRPTRGSSTPLSSQEECLEMCIGLCIGFDIAYLPDGTVLCEHFTMPEEIDFVNKPVTVPRIMGTTTECASLPAQSFYNQEHAMGMNTYCYDDMAANFMRVYSDGGNSAVSPAINLTAAHFRCFAAGGNLDSPIDYGKVQGVCDLEDACPAMVSTVENCMWEQGIKAIKNANTTLNDDSSEMRPMGTCYQQCQNLYDLMNSWTEYRGIKSNGFATGDEGSSRHDTLELAKTACLVLGVDACKAVTCLCVDTACATFTHCEVRSEMITTTNVVSSANSGLNEDGELTYVTYQQTCSHFMTNQEKAQRDTGLYSMFTSGPMAQEAIKQTSISCACGSFYDNVLMPCVTHGCSMCDAVLAHADATKCTETMNMGFWMKEVGAADMGTSMGMNMLQGDDNMTLADVVAISKHTCRSNDNCMTLIEKLHTDCNLPSEMPHVETFMSTMISEAKCEDACNATLRSLMTSDCIKRSDTDMTMMMLGGMTPDGMLTTNISGVDACEGHGFHNESCLEIGCCHYMDGHCKSSVGSDMCIMSDKAKGMANRDLMMGLTGEAKMLCDLDAACPAEVTDLLGHCMDHMMMMQKVGVTQAAACHKHSYNQADCNAVGCCQYSPEGVQLPQDGSSFTEHCLSSYMNSEAMCWPDEPSTEQEFFESMTCNASAPCLMLDAKLNSIHAKQTNHTHCKDFLMERMSTQVFEMATMSADMCKCTHLSRNATHNPLHVCPTSVQMALAPMIQISLDHMDTMMPPHMDAMVAGAGTSSAAMCTSQCRAAITNLMADDGCFSLMGTETMKMMMDSMMSMMMPGQPAEQTSVSSGSLPPGPAAMGVQLTEMMCDQMVGSSQMEEFIKMVGDMTQEMFGSMTTEQAGMQCPFDITEMEGGDDVQQLCTMYDDMMVTADGVGRNITQIMQDAKWWSTTTTTSSTTSTATTATATTTTTTTLESIEVDSSLAHSFSALVLALGLAIAIGVKH